MYITVIIPTFRRPETLMKGIQSLQQQVYKDFEILVVDNAGDPTLERTIADYNLTALVPVRYIPEPNLGLHHARHAGARAARGDVLVFTDDDATFAPDWLQAYADAFVEHPEMMAAGGPVRPVWEVPPPQWLLDYMGASDMFPILSLMEPYKEFRLDERGFFFGVNMAIRRDVLFEVGGFNPESFGVVWLGDGESGLNRKLWTREMLIGYVPEAIVHHHIPPSRMTLEYFRHRMANEGACDMYARFHEEGIYWFDLLKYTTSLMLRSGKSWIAAAWLKGRTDPRSLQIQLNAARTQSRLKYLLRLAFDKEFRMLVLKKDWLNEPCASVSSPS